MKTSEFGNTYAERLAMAFATALSGDDNLFSPPKRRYSVATLRKYFEAANRAVDKAFATGDDAKIDAAVDKRERWLEELESAGVDVWHDADLW